MTRTREGLRVVAFTHAIDCRSGHVASTEAWGGVCSGSRRGNLYLQYWLYYPGSATAEGWTPLKARSAVSAGHSGIRRFHPDDWEGWQVRIGRGGTFSRATSHHGYNGWLPDQERYSISGGSHAGRPLERPARSWIPVRIPPRRPDHQGRAAGADPARDSAGPRALHVRDQSAVAQARLVRP